MRADARPTVRLGWMLFEWAAIFEQTCLGEAHAMAAPELVMSGERLTVGVDGGPLWRCRMRKWEGRDSGEEGSGVPPAPKAWH